MSGLNAARNVIEWAINRGRNGWDLAKDILEGQTTESMNVLLGQSTLGSKRNGSVAQTFTGDTFSGYNAIGRFIAAQDDTAAQFFIVDRSGTIKILRVSGGSSATNLTLLFGVLTTRPQDCSFATINGKFYIAVRLTGSTNRLLVYDPTGSTSVVRGAGIVTPAAPTAADGGASAIPATNRLYRVAWATLTGSRIRRRSLYGTALSFTNTINKNTTVTQPAAPAANEGVTHWYVAGSSDGGETYYVLSSAIAIGTTTFSDTVDPANYGDAGQAAIPPEGTNTPWPAVPYLATDGRRLIGFGAFEPDANVTTAGTLSPKNGRVYFSPVLDSSEVEDDERVSNTTSIQGWIDIARNHGSEDRALIGPIDGQFLVFFSRGIYLLIPKGSIQNPFAKVELSQVLGAVNQWSSFVGEDEYGRPCIYFLDPVRGPYRYGADGLQYLGEDVQDVWATFNPAATGRTAHGVYHTELKLCMWWIATGSANDPSEMICFAVNEGRTLRDRDGNIAVRYGWTRWTIPEASQRCSVLFSKTFAATMSRLWKPYAGGSANLLRCDDETVTADNAVAFQAYVTSRAWAFDKALRFLKQLGNAFLLAGAAAGVTIRQTLIRNFGDEPSPRTSDVSLTLLAEEGSATSVLRNFTNAELKDAFVFQVKLGDANAVSNAWDLHDYEATVEVTNEERKK